MGDTLQTLRELAAKAEEDEARVYLAAWAAVPITAALLWSWVFVDTGEPHAMLFALAHAGFGGIALVRYRERSRHDR